MGDENPATVRVEISTAEGRFVIEVYPEAAPLSAQNFLAYVEQNFMGQGNAYRITTLTNEPEKPFPIEVIQFGWNDPVTGPTAAPFAPIAHESTEQSGLRHKQGAVSTARFARDTGGYGFFICMRDEPELDFGGRRHADGFGFSAFGRIVSGWQTVQRIFAHAQEQDYLTHPIGMVAQRL